MTIPLRINGEPFDLDVAPDTPLLWVLRDTVGLTGTKFGCGVAACGACTVHVDGNPIRSCLLPISAVTGQDVTTIEGVSDHAGAAIQRAWIAEQVPQCGYCQSGMIMAATALLRRRPDPSDDEINQAMTNICRCGTYQRIRRAIHRAADELQDQTAEVTHG